MRDHVWNAHPESDLSPEALRAKYQATPEGHPRFPKTDWQYEVENEDTVLGYWEWVMHQIEAWQPEDDEEGEA